MDIKNIAYWYPLISGGFCVLMGWACYRLEKYIIGEDSKLNKYRASPNSILIKLKLFKYDWRFNYLLLIPYLISITVFLLILLLYILYWIGISQIGYVLWSVWFNILLIFLTLLIMVYAGSIQEYIFHNG